MQATSVMFHQFGKPEDVLNLTTRNIEKLEYDDILVKMIARPINPSDLIPITGAYAHRISLPTIPGYEGVGVVEAVGQGVLHSLIGKWVLPLRGEGTWQEYVTTSAQKAIVLPDEIDHLTAAQLYINPVTAWVICREVLQLKEDDVLVVNACGSAIGRLFTQFSQIIGFRLIAVTRHDHDTEDLLKLGASAVVNTANQSLYDTVMELTNGRGAYAAIDSVGGEAGTQLARSLQVGGQFITIGLLSGQQVNWAHIAQANRIKANIFHLRHWNKTVTDERWQATFRTLIQFIMKGQLRLMNLHTTYDLADVKKAVQHAPRFKGKVFLTSDF